MSPSLNTLLEPARAGIIGLGMSVPEHVLTNAELARRVDTTDEWIVTRTGIRERRIAGRDTATSDLAIRAAQQALDDARISPAEIDLVLCATTSGDYLWPATACIVQDRLRAVRAAAFDLSAACSGFCYGLAAAAAFIQSGAMKHVLVIGADTLSKQLDWSDRSTCVLFGDGAGAAVLGPCAGDRGVLASVLGADGSGVESIWIKGGGSRSGPESGRGYIAMQGKEVYRFAVNVVPDVVNEVLRRACLEPADIDLLVMHQANVRIMRAAAERLSLPWERVFVNVDRYGNTSAASIPIALTEARRQRKMKRDAIVVTVGFGAGLTWAANLMRWSLD